MTKRSIPAGEGTAYAAATFSVAEGEGRKVIQLLAIGNVEPRNGVPKRVVVADRAHADAIVTASQAYHGGTDMVVDYDHQSVWGAQPGVGGQAKAAGWAKRLFATDQGVFAEVEWNAAASAALDAREYRYISPVFKFETATGRVTRIINASLTNTPNLDLVAVASALTTEKDVQNMDLTKIAGALGLGAEADEAAVLSAIGGLTGFKTQLAATASALGLTATATGEEIAAAAATAKAAAGEVDPAKFVPIEAVTQMQATMSSMQAQLDTIGGDRRAKMVDDAIAAGKLFPAERAGMIAWAAKDEAACSAAIAVRPVFKGGAVVTEPAEGKGAMLTAEEKAFCSAMGLTEEAFLAARKDEVSA